MPSGSGRSWWHLGHECSRGPSDALADPEALDHVVEYMTKDDAWALYGWAVGACAWAVRSSSEHVLRSAVQALTLLDSNLDRRDLLVVATLARRAGSGLGATFDELTLSDLGADEQSPAPWLLMASEDLPVTRTEVGDGSSFAFRRVPSTFDPEVLQELSTNDWFSPGLLRGMLTGERATGELSALDHQVEFLTDRWAMALQKARTDPGAGAAMREIRRDYVNHRFGLQL